MSAFGCLLVPAVECPAEFIVAPSEEDREVVLSERKHLFPDPLAAASSPSHWDARRNLQQFPEYKEV